MTCARVSCDNRCERERGFADSQLITRFKELTRSIDDRGSDILGCDLWRYRYFWDDMLDL
jgi:hypothetical protein